MKKIITVLSILLLCACSTIKGGDLEDIKKRGKLVVAMEGTWKPFTYHDDDNNLVGYDVEVAKYIADYIGVEIEYVEGEWDGLLMGVEDGRYDMLVNGVDYTEDRKDSYDFSNAYGYDRVVVMVKKDNNDINSIEDLKGKKTANTISSVYAEIAREQGAEVTGVDELIDTLKLLKDGRIDATVNAEVVYYDYINDNPDADIKIACYAENVWDIAIPMKKGSHELVQIVNEAIAQGLSDGTFARLSQKYFGIDITVK